VPTISNVQVTGVTATGATVTWNTDVASDSQVEYGPTSAYGSATALDPAGVTNHSRTLTGLTAGTTYHFRARSADTVASSDPQSISGIAARWRAADLTGLSASDPVGVWTSGIGGLVATQPVASRRPIYLPGTQNGRAGLQFDGISDHLNAGNVLGLTGAATFQVVFKFNDLNAFSMLLTKSGQYELRRDSATDALHGITLPAGTAQGALSATATLTAYHVWTFVTDPTGTGQWYLDGVASGSPLTYSPAGAVPAVTADALIGARANGGVLEPYCAPMTLLELNVYSVALDASTRHGSELFLGNYYNVAVT
jgi:hypothetical protein